MSTNSETNFFQSDGQPAVLADGKDVIVEGVWDQVTGKLVAKSVRVLTAEDEQGEDASAEGPVTEFSADQGFVRIDTHEAEGFVPLANSVRIEFNENTVFVSGDDAITKDQFFALLAHGVELEAEGSYNPGMFVLTASHVHLHHEGGAGDGDGGGTTGGDTSGGSTGETTGSTGDTTGGSTGDTTGTTGDTTGGSTGETTGSTGTTGEIGGSTGETTGTTGDTTGGSTGETTGTTGDTAGGSTGETSGSSSSTGETTGSSTGETTGTTGTTGESGSTTGIN